MVPLTPYGIWELHWSAPPAIQLAGSGAGYLATLSLVKTSCGGGALLLMKVGSTGVKSNLGLTPRETLITFFSMDSIISFCKGEGMEFAVSKVAEFLTDKICKFGRDILMTYGMEQALLLLDEFTIKKILKRVLRKIALSAYNLLAIRG